jgi:hypothetical protein
VARISGEFDGCKLFQQLDSTPSPEHLVRNYFNHFLIVKREQVNLQIRLAAAKDVHLDSNRISMLPKKAQLQWLEKEASVNVHNEEQNREKFDLCLDRLSFWYEQAPDEEPS